MNLKDNGFDFSFSGVKTAVLNYINNAEQKGEEINKYDIAASFQEAVVDVLSEHLIECAKLTGADKVALAGGVAANVPLRERVKSKAAEAGMGFYFPNMKLCTDNAAMIGCAAFAEYESGVVADLSLNAIANLPL